MVPSGQWCSQATGAGVPGGASRVKVGRAWPQGQPGRVMHPDPIERMGLDQEEASPRPQPGVALLSPLREVGNPGQGALAGVDQIGRPLPCRLWGQDIGFDPGGRGTESRRLGPGLREHRRTAIEANNLSGAEPPAGEGLEPVTALQVHCAATPGREVLEVREFEGQKAMPAGTEVRDVGLDLIGVNRGGDLPGVGGRVR